MGYSGNIEKDLDDDGIHYMKECFIKWIMTQPYLISRGELTHFVEQTVINYRKKKIDEQICEKKTNSVCDDNK